MKQEDKELLLKDLCSRLPCGVNVDYDNNACEVLSIDKYNEELNIWKSPGYSPIVKLEEVKPYLFPLSSMTEEQTKELFDLFGIDLLDSVGADYIKINEITGITFFLNRGFDVETHLGNLIDWFNKNHLDWRGLIPKGLAIDANGLNVY